ncbi:hypothetical protein GXM_00407 [Nostoc sphaeroides CCNUC1]|uniref:Uncharacterized protein n=1 Tax=Nostoc sphaeroides CCNUC1 TaxID=2653204 RepID=A0A5P8VRM1_9NOSO|nr:hypothetical protein GXM_00407 [Nostoc sphaeroides CCNUC1]
MLYFRRVVLAIICLLEKPFIVAHLNVAQPTEISLDFFH